MRKSRWGNEFNCNYAKIKTKIKATAESTTAHNKPDNSCKSNTNLLAHTNTQAQTLGNKSRAQTLNNSADYF